jgi:hypothetical protein
VKSLVAAIAIAVVGLTLGALVAEGCRPEPVPAAASRIEVSSADVVPAVFYEEPGAPQLAPPFLELAQAPACPAADPAPGVELADLVRGITSGDWPAVLASLLLVLIWVLRTGGAAFLVWAPGEATTAIATFLKSDAGGALTALLLPILAAWSSALHGGVPITGELTWAAIKIGLLAAGGWTVLVRRLGPWLLSHAKALLHPASSVLTLAVLVGAAGCVSAGGMLKVQANLWRDGGIAHLAASRPPTPGDAATAPELAAYGDWQRAVLVAASTVCTDDKSEPACTCADTAPTSAIDCDRFLAGGP